VARLYKGNGLSNRTSNFTVINVVFLILLSSLKKLNPINQKYNILPGPYVLCSK